MPNRQPAALLGDVITLKGRNLSGNQVSVKFSNPRLGLLVELAAASGASDDTVSVKLPNDPSVWPAGLYTIAVVVKGGVQPGRTSTSNEWPLAIAPQITSQQRPIQAELVQGAATISLTCTPEVRAEQRVSLLLGGREIPAAPRDGQTGALTFVVTDAVAGTFWIRLRVDGVDSRLVDHSTSPPKFIESERAVIR
jgi:hypothetical protein